jgi:cell division protein FtsI (penicillin-binding protein 3)
VAALLELGRLAPNELIDAPMHLRVGSKTFSDVVQHDPKLTAWDILRFSSNSAMIHLSQRLSDLEQQVWLERFGFNRDVNVPGAFTRSGVVRDPPWYPQDKAAITIGQSLSATSLQLAAAYSVFANDGLYVTPYLIEGQPGLPPERVVSAETAAYLRAMLRHTAEKSSISRYPVPGVSVAGKTGTADVYDVAAGAYVRGDYNVSFAGMLPAERPRFIISVTVHKPRTETMSTFVAVPLFSEIAKEAVALWQLPTDPALLATQP